MRHTIWILALVAPFVTLFIGAVFNFIGWFGFDTAIPYDQPRVIIITSIGLIPGVALAMTGLIMGIRDAARNHRGLWFWGQLVWPLIIVLFAILFFHNFTLGPSWWMVVTMLSLPALLYGLLAPLQSAPMPGKGLREVFFMAILNAVVVAGIITILLSPSAGATQQPSVLTASVSSANTDCVNGNYPLIVLQNSSGKAVTWSTKSVFDSTLIITPASGTLVAHGTINVTISGKTAEPAIIINFAGGSDNVAVVKLSCTTGK